jgi:hypothetical protein
VIALATALVVVVMAAGTPDRRRGSDVVTGGPPPPEATDTLGLLASADAGTRLSAFDAGVAAAFGDDGVPALPAGATVTLDDDGWRSEIDGFANAAGAIVDRDGRRDPVELAFVRTADRWLIVSLAEQS